MAPTTETGSNDKGRVPVGKTANEASNTTLSPLDASRLIISLSKDPLPIPPDSDASTRTHTDHILTATWTATHGWSAPQIAPYANLSLPPTASVLQYATSCFEGMKLYRGFDGKLRLFRPIDNCRRLLDSATRISLPSFEPAELEKLIKELCRIDGSRWLPKKTGSGTCLYLRPTMIGIDADLGFRVPQEVLLYVVITYWPSPKVPIHPARSEAQPDGLKLWASTSRWVRAWPGGSGNAKLAANYGPALMADREAKRRGYDQVLWLFGDDGRVTEAGSANFFVVWKSKAETIELVTPPLESELILPGITRRSVLELARKRFGNTDKWEIDGNTVSATKVDVLEKDFTIFDIAEAVKEERLLGAFVVGTAAFVISVSQIHALDQDIDFVVDRVPHAALLRKWLNDIMYGVEDNVWTTVIDG